MEKTILYTVSDYDGTDNSTTGKELGNKIPNGHAMAGHYCHSMVI